MALNGGHNVGDANHVVDHNAIDAAIIQIQSNITSLQNALNALSGATTTVPGAPVNVVASPKNASASITFTAPASNGGATITSYVATSSPGNFTGTGTITSPITITGLTNGTSYTFTVKAVNSVGTGPASSPSAAVVPVSGATGTITTTYPLPLLTRTGSNLQVNGVNKRLSGLNCYWLGLDDNAGINFPSHTTITNAMIGMREMGVTLTRAHTVGISTGTSQSFLTGYSGTTPNYVDANMDSADWAVYQAGLKGIYMMVPLTDNWNYYHGGKWNFVHWAYQQNPSGIIDTPGGTKDDLNERIFFASNAAGLRVRALFKDYISHLLNHVNPYTGLAYKDDPTIAIIETGNEIYFSAQLGNATPVAPDPNWVQDIASYVKSIAPNKLVADGAAASGSAVSTHQGITAAACDIVGGHYYPQDPAANYGPALFNKVASSFPAGSARQQLTTDVNAAATANKPFILGEYPWTRADVNDWYGDIEANALIDADMAWAFIAASEGHGAGFGSDDFPVHRPYLGGNEQSYAPTLANHISTISGVATTNGAGPTVTGPPVNTMASAAVARVEGVAATKYAAGISTGTVPTLALDTTTFAEGTSSLKVTTVSAGYPYVYVSNALDGAPVVAGNAYTATVFAKNVNGFTSGNAHITWFDGAGSYISGVDGTVAYTLTTSSWTQLSITATAPTGAKYAVPQFQAAATSINAGSVVNLDKWGVFPGTSATPWVSPV